MTYIDPDKGTRKFIQLVKIENGIPIKIDNRPLIEWKTDSGKIPTYEWFASQGYYGLISINPEITDDEGYFKSKNISEWIVNENDKTVIQTWDIIYWTEEEKNQINIKKIEEENIEIQYHWNTLRQLRNDKLKDCDWTQLKDVDSTLSAEWEIYRQALRDLPSNTIDPKNPIWPKRPDGFMEEGEI